MSDFNACLDADLAPAPAAQRKRLEPDIASAVDHANREFSARLRTPFHVLGAGRWRGVMASIGDALEADLYFNHALFPARICTGIGVGSTEGLDTEGPCFSRARRGLEASRSSGGGTTLSSGNALLDLGTNTIMMLLHTLREGWTPKQLEAYQEFLREGTENRAAQSLGISQSALHQRLSAARAKVYEQARTQLFEFVERCAHRA